MSDTFITSDEHYGHRSIIEACQRPFKSVAHMTEVLVANHNAKVPNSKNYLTIHAGDMFWLTMSEQEAMVTLGRLNGRHAFIWGNHDKTIAQGKNLQRMFDWVRDAHTLHFNKKKLTIYHYAQRVWNGSGRGAWHVYGHSHGELPGLGKSFDIGVDCHNFTPWSLEEIEAKMAKTKDSLIGQSATFDANVAQQAEQGFCEPQVGGSIPSVGSRLKLDHTEYLENIARWEDA